MELYLKYDKPLNEFEIDKYRKFISRRGKREPLQYIIGKVEFYGLNFIVNPSVLIPRQETEILIDTILSESANKEQINILDIGAGSGNISIAISYNLPLANVFSIDNDRNALEIAKKNSELNNVKDNLRFLLSDINNYMPESGMKFDIIVSNPPYISLQHYNNLDIELLDYEPKSALTDQKDGYSFYKIISNKSAKLLKKNGKLFFEVGINQAENVEKIMLQNGFEVVKKVKDYLGIDRVVWGELK